MFINTQVATAAAMLGWLAYEKLRHGSFTTLGAASGAVAGLVAITPACGSVSPLGAIALGADRRRHLRRGGRPEVPLRLRRLARRGRRPPGRRHRRLPARSASSPPAASATTAKGLFYGGGLDQLGKQAIGVGAVLGYSLSCAAILAMLIDKTIGFRVTEDEEIAGIDQVEHAETAYDFAGGRRRARAPAVAAASARRTPPPAKKVDA